MSVPVSPSTVLVALRGVVDGSDSRSCRPTGERHVRSLTVSAVVCRPVVLAPRCWPLPDRLSRALDHAVGLSGLGRQTRQNSRRSACRIERPSWRPCGEQKCPSRPSVPAHARKVVQ